MELLPDIDRLDHRDAEVIRRTCALIGPALRAYFRCEVRGLDRLPDGAALLVGNHNGGLLSPDTFILGEALFTQRGIDDVPFGLAHEVVLRLPPFSQILLPIGAVRASHENARRLFAAGRKVLVYPGGDVEAMRPFRARNRIVFDGRRGYVRLALRNGVPIVPVVAAGAHATFLILDDLRWLARLLGADRRLRIKVWPLTLSCPWGLTLGPAPPHIPFPSRILVEALPPIRFARAGAAAAADEASVAACAAQVEQAMQAALDRLAAERRRA